MSSLFAIVGQRDSLSSDEVEAPIGFRRYIQIQLGTPYSYSCRDKVYGPPIELDTIIYDSYFRESAAAGASSLPFLIGLRRLLTSPAEILKF